jgi:iron complex transport system substrate-binding protein
MDRRLAVLIAVIVFGSVAAGGVVADAGSTGVEAAGSSIGPHDAGSPALDSATQDGCEFPLEVTDATGETIVLDEEPETVVVTAPNVAQQIWEIGAEEKVIGMPVNVFTAYLNGSEDRTNVVGDQGMAVQETIVDLDPDLVLAPNVTFPESIEGLRDADQTVYHYRKATDLESVMDQTERTGQLVGACAGAADVVDGMGEAISNIESAVADEPAPTVYYDLGFPFTAGGNTVENDIIATAGGDNLAADVGDGYFQISEETIAAEDPEWIIIPEGGEVPDVAGLQESTAVENDQIIEVNSNFLSQHGPRNLEPLRQFAEAFHQEAIARMEATPTATPTETPTATPTETATPTDGDDSADDDGAGFAVGAAVAAIAGLAVLARRRA